MPERDPVTWSARHAARWEALAEELRRRLGAGTPVPIAERATLEPRLGADVNGAALHRGALPGSLARAAGGQAIAVGQHVLGAASDLDASTPRGAALLGHELTHALRPAAMPRHPVASLQRAVRPPDASQDEDEEIEAQRVEAALLDQAPDRHAPAAAPGVDAEALADRVYRRLLDQLLLDGERAAWLG
jgi:hypothetical protein